MPVGTQHHGILCTFIALFLRTTCHQRGFRTGLGQSWMRSRLKFVACSVPWGMRRQENAWPRMGNARSFGRAWVAVLRMRPRWTISGICRTKTVPRPMTFSHQDGEPFAVDIGCCHRAAAGDSCPTLCQEQLTASFYESVLSPRQVDQTDVRLASLA